MGAVTSDGLYNLCWRPGGETGRSSWLLKLGTTKNLELNCPKQARDIGCIEVGEEG